MFHKINTECIILWLVLWNRKYIEILARKIIWRKRVASQQEIESNNNIDFTLKTSELYPQKAFSSNAERKVNISGAY